MTSQPAGESYGQRINVLPELLADVVAARRYEEEQARLTPRNTNAVALAEARQLTLKALLAYAEAIEALSWPVPRSMLSEIKMHKILCSRRPWGTGGD